MHWTAALASTPTEVQEDWRHGSARGDTVPSPCSRRLPVCVLTESWLGTKLATLLLQQAWLLLSQSHEQGAASICGTQLLSNCRAFAGATYMLSL